MKKFLLLPFIIVSLFVKAQSPFTNIYGYQQFIPNESAAQRITDNYLDAVGATNYQRYVLKNTTKSLEEAGLYYKLHKLTFYQFWSNGRSLNFVNPEAYNGAFRDSVRAGTIVTTSTGITLSNGDTVDTYWRNNLASNAPYCGFGYYVTSSVAPQILGSASPFRIFPRDGGTTSYVNVWNNSPGVAVPAPPTGFNYFQRRNADTVDSYQGTTRYYALSSLNNANPQDSTCYLLGNSTADYTIRVSFISDVLTDAEIAILKSIIDQYITWIDNPGSTALRPYTSAYYAGPVMKGIITSINQFHTGANGVLDDGRMFVIGDTTYWFSGTDNFATFNQFVATGDKGVHWIYGPNAPWSDRNAMGVSNPIPGLPLRAYMWGGRNFAGTNFADAWYYENGLWTRITTTMTGWSTTRSQWMFCRTNTKWITVGGFNGLDVIESSDLQSWTVISSGASFPDSLKTCGTSSVCWDSISNTMYLVGGFNTTLAAYNTKIWRSLDSGRTWASIIDNAIFGDQWPSITALNQGLLYIRGNNGANQQGSYFCRRGLDPANINNWVRLPDEYFPTHATPVVLSLDRNEAIACCGNFPNGSMLFLDVSRR